MYVVSGFSRTLLHAVNGRDVRVIQRREEFRPTLETRQTIAIACEQLGKNFQRNVPMESGSAGAIDFAHSSRPDGREDLVGAETRAGRKRHRLLG